jgi:hypothetical protein
MKGEIMKRLVFALLAFWMLLCIAEVSFAAALGTSSIATETLSILGKGERKVITITWAGSADDGSMPAVTVSATTYGIKGWYLYTVETNPGSGPPTASYDIVINDADGVDIAGGKLANRHTTTTELVNIGTATHGYPLVRGNLSVVLTGNSQTSATGTIIMIFLAN